MPTYSYTKLADYILDQLWGFASVNSLKNSLRYIGEDILGDPSANGDKIPALNFDNGATHGGRLNFNGGTTSYVGSDATGLIFQVAGFTSATIPSGVANSIIDAYTRTTGTSVGVRGVAISGSSGSFSSTSGSYVDVTNLSVTIISSGRPIFLILGHDGISSASPARIRTTISTGSTSPASKYKIVRDAATDVATFNHEMTADTSATENTIAVSLPPACVAAIDPVAAGTYTYKLQTLTTAGVGTVFVDNCKLYAFEL